MNRKIVYAWVAFASIYGATMLGRDQVRADEAVAPDQSEQQRLIARGKYLTHDVAMCVICHSPKDESGRVIESREFQGAPIPVASPFPQGRPWAVNAPALPTMVSNREQAVFHLLTTGVWSPSGDAPLMPMPPFRMNDDDARAVIAYLKTK